MVSGPRDALERFRSLEEQIARVLEALQKARQENENTRKELASARRELKTLHKEIEGLRKQRILVRGRVERLMESISELSEKQVV